MGDGGEESTAGGWEGGMLTVSTPAITKMIRISKWSGKKRYERTRESGSSYPLNRILILILILHRLRLRLSHTILLEISSYEFLYH